MVYGVRRQDGGSGCVAVPGVVSARSHRAGTRRPAVVQRRRRDVGDVMRRRQRRRQQQDVAAASAMPVSLSTLVRHTQRARYVPARLSRSCSGRLRRFAARRSASATYAVVVCLRVRLSHAGTVSERVDESRWGLFGLHVSLGLS